MLPQYTYLALTVFGLGISIARHGQMRSPENFVTTLISSALCVGLLIAGGFFKGII